MLLAVRSCLNAINIYGYYKHTVQPYPTLKNSTPSNDSESERARDSPETGDQDDANENTKKR
jgi:hypothetical protein